MTTKHTYSKHRDGGWYVHTVRYSSGACGHVAPNPSGKGWMIVCDNRIPQPAYRTRDAAADAEAAIAAGKVPGYTIPTIPYPNTEHETTTTLALDLSSIGIADAIDWINDHLPAGHKVTRWTWGEPGTFLIIIDTP